MTRSLASAVSRIAYVMRSVSARVPADEIEDGLAQATVLAYRDVLVLLNGVDELGNIADFQTAVEAALQENPK